MQYLSQRLASESTKARDARPPRGPVAATQRERMLAATEQLIAKKGCTGTSIEAIVKAAKVSSVTFYEHFEDKEACFVATFDRAVEEAQAVLLKAVPSGLPWPDQVREGLRTLLAMIGTDPGRARMCLVEAQMGGPALSARYEATLDRAMRWLSQGRALESASGGLADTVEEATIGGIAWLLRERLERGGGGVEDLLPKLVEIALSPYLGDDGAQPPAVAEPV
jgi:AcrR family transcriptional regulator